MLQHQDLRSLAYKLCGHYGFGFFAFGRKRSKPSSCCLVRRIEHAVIGPTYAHHGLRRLLHHLHAAAVEASAVLVDYRAE